jgi:ComF family protein
MIFDGLSTFSPGAAVQLLKNSAAWKGACALCLADAGSDRVCRDCSGSLPRLGPACPRCALPMPQMQVCGRCLLRPPAFDATVAAFEYRFPVDRLVQRFKFAGDLAAGRWLAQRLAAAVRTRPDLLVVAPLTAARLRTRGFNQALEIARVVGAATGARVGARALEKVRDTAPQPGLGGRERRQNLRGAFRVTGSMAGRHVAIVDDVMTTGATVAELARVLRQAGARRVDVWVVARTPPGRR